MNMGHFGLKFPSSNSPSRNDSVPSLGFGFLLGLLLLVLWSNLGRAEAPPVGQFLQLEGTVTAESLSRVSRVAFDLRERAQKQGSQAILILQIQDGLSRYGDVRDLAKFLASDIPQIRTIAWIPSDLRGINGLIPLACHEIVMAPQAGFGDFGRGRPVDPDTQAFALSLVAQRRNPLLPEALVKGLVDRDQEVLWIRLRTNQADPPTFESRVINAPEVERLTAEKAVIEDRRTLKPAGSDALFLGSTCRELNILTSNLFDDSRQLLAHYRLGADAARNQHTAGTDLKVSLIQIKGVIDTMYEEFLHRQVERQIAAGANLLIFEVDSPGGMLEPCLRLAEIFAECEDRKVRTIAWIPRRAISGGAIVSFGCDEVYMQPDALIGDAQPIEVRPGEAFARVPEKILSKVVQDMKVIAERKNRPVALLQAMVDKDLEVFKCTDRKTGEIAYLSDLEIVQEPDRWNKGALVPESKADMILTVTGRRAHELQLAEAPVKDFDELKQRLQIPVQKKLAPLAPMFVDRLVFTLNNPLITGALLFLGVICIYMEAHIPSGLFAIGALICFALFFWSRFLGGTAGWLEVVLFLLGMGFLAIEFFVLPGFGVFGVSGGLLVIISLVLAGQTFWIPITTQDYAELSRSASTLLIAIVVFGAVAFSISRFLPRSRLWDHVVLVPPGAKPLASGNEPLLSPSALGNTSHPLLGARGQAASILRPSGKGRFGEEYLDVVSDGPFIDQGSPIEIISVQGVRIVVRKVV